MGCGATSSGHGACGKVFWGGLMVIVGGLFLADHMAYLDAGETLSAFWPLLLVFLGLTMMFGAKRNLFWGLAVTGVGAVLLMQELEVISGGVWGYIWPGLLILAGLGMIFRNRKPASGGGSQNVSSGKLDHSSTFSEARYIVNSQAFEGGRISASFSETQLDLTQASTLLGSVELRVDCSFGHVIIRTPAAWKVELQIKSVAGDVKDHRGVAAQTGPTLVLKGDVMFGSIEVF